MFMAFLCPQFQKLSFHKKGMYENHIVFPVIYKRSGFQDKFKTNQLSPSNMLRRAVKKKIFARLSHLTRNINNSKVG